MITHDWNIICIEICILLSLLFYTTYTCDASCEIYLSNEDFKDGTFRITQSGIYCLTQDILFNPNPSSISNPNADHSWFPLDDSKYPGCHTLTGGAYSLGWFAAITIETNNVELNLCGYKISQSIEFNIQQRWFNVIEIANAPFEFGHGPTDFGAIDQCHSIYIHNGQLGLSSHNSIHSNSARNVRVENLKLIDFEVAGIQFNGASNILIKNIRIGPSNDNVKPTAYYSNARFTAMAMRLLLNKITYNPNTKYITYSNGKTLSLQQIFDDLITSMDIAYRYFLNQNTVEDINNELYDISKQLYWNKFGLPDGSAIYGIVLNSFDWAIFGLGQERNEAGDGEKIVIENVQIYNLKLHTNEFPNIYFDECNDINSKTQTIIKGPFGDTMDIRKMIDTKYKNVIDNGGDVSQLKYIGNPLDNARIALALLGPAFDLQFGSVGLDNKHFFGWVLDKYEDISYDTLPLCSSFICNSDIMFHNNKGIIGVRADLIEELTINGIRIRKLINKTPLNSFACGPYEGPNDGGHPTQLQGYGGLGTSVTGMTIYGGDVIINNGKYKQNVITLLKSKYGYVIGIHVFNDAIVLFDDTIVEISNMQTCKSLTNNDIKKLKKQGKYPFPNSCFICNILKDPIDYSNDMYVEPFPPNGIDKIYCYDTRNKNIHLPSKRTIYEPKRQKLIYYANDDIQYRNLNWDPQYGLDDYTNEK